MSFSKDVNKSKKQKKPKNKDDFFFFFFFFKLTGSITTGSYIIPVSHVDVLTLLTPASSRISFISPSGGGGS